MEEKKKRKRERTQEIAAQNKELERIKKAQKDQKDEKELWELNASFAKMKEHKKLNNKKRKSLVNLTLVFDVYILS